MLKWERKLIEFVEKHMCLLCALFLSLLALYLRKIAVWWTYDSLSSYFDMHENYTGTAAYFLIVKMVQYLPVLPGHSIKWIAGLSDFGVAALVVYLLGREIDDRKRLIFYTACLYSPVMFMRGIIWAQLDSVAVLLLLAGYALYGKKVQCALILAIGAVVLCPYLFPAVILYLWKRERNTKELWYRIFLLTFGGLLVQTVSALLIGERWTEGVFSGVRFLTYHPETGMLYEDAAQWMLQMFYLYSPAAVVLAALAAGKKKISYSWTITIHVAATVLYGANLFVPPA